MTSADPIPKADDIPEADLAEQQIPIDVNADEEGLDPTTSRTQAPWTPTRPTSSTKPSAFHFPPTTTTSSTEITGQYLLKSSSQYRRPAVAALAATGTCRGTSGARAAPFPDARGGHRPLHRGFESQGGV